ncbi:GGDEF domain-containing protein [uncultured Paracoccus sp.]|uniref:GGDEF domain-containing protein n=1 Tax=uncultured Paracoccus sp. TaxID=189685 RepID=UPI002622E0D9|nr:GGDEF domain-containing protein [uncultured Paracoccus sp.]
MNARISNGKNAAPDEKKDALQTRLVRGAAPQAEPPGIAIPTETALGRIMPMAAVIGPDGRIAYAGPTLRKLIGDVTRFASAFDPIRHARASGQSSPLPDEGRVFLRLRAHPGVTLRGDAVRLCDGTTLLNLGFGIGLESAVRQFALTDQDFASAELAMEMLFLHEANAAMLAELSRSNLQLEEARQAAEVQAFTDPLTGLCNRRGAQAALELAMRAAFPASGRGRQFGLIHLDLDLFKELNDLHGHAAGDDMLRAVALKLREVVRSDDAVARMGGDEFLLILPGLTDRCGLQRLAQRIIRRIGSPVPVGRATCRVSASIGISVSTAYETADAETMLEDADRALYAAKHAGRARLVFAEDLPPGRIDRDAPRGRRAEDRPDPA